MEFTHDNYNFKIHNGVIEKGIKKFKITVDKGGEDIISLKLNAISKMTNELIEKEIKKNWEQTKKTFNL